MSIDLRRDDGRFTFVVEKGVGMSWLQTYILGFPKSHDKMIVPQNG